jgi:Spt5 transcription elongation factor, acidic N-terminal
VEPLDEGEEVDINRRAADHARLDRERELDTQDYAQIAEDLNRRYAKAPVRYTGDMNEVPQRLLMPSVHDANLWQVRVKVCIMSQSTMKLAPIIIIARPGTRHRFQSYAQSYRP